MRTLEQIKQAIAALKPREVSQLADWFMDFQNDLWDKQIAEDAASGKLNKFASQALASHKAGRTKML